MIEPEHSSHPESGADSSAASAMESTSPGGGRGDMPVRPALSEPPRRRLVAELLAGQEDVEESVRRDALKAELHPETIDAGQPVYQLDLSSEEPRGTLVESTRPREAEPDAEPVDHHSAISAAAAHNAVKHLVMQRDRQVMAAERDGVDAYELAVDLDAYVERVIDTVRRAGRFPDE